MITNKVWNVEKSLKIKKIGTIVTILKKGDKRGCKYQGIFINKRCFKGLKESKRAATQYTAQV